MGHSNETPNLHLSQFEGGTDKPGWVADYNADMLKIDNSAMKNEDYDPSSEVKVAGGISAYGELKYAPKGQPTQWVLLKSGMTWGVGETQVIPDSSKYAMLAFETTTGRMTGVRVTQGGPMTIFNVNIASTGTYLQIGSGLASTNGDSITLTQLAYQRLTPGSAIPTPVNVTVSAVYGLATT